jgi:superfamily I DNA/RNA helicase
MRWLVDYENLSSRDGSNQQEIVEKARELINGDTSQAAIIVKGPAGTGKTLVLAHIALKVPEKRGFFFIYTNVLLKFLNSAFSAANNAFTETNVGVNTFDKWLYDLYNNTFHERPPDISPYVDKAAHMIERLTPRITGNLFDYVLVDEGQDFRPNVIAFIRAVARVVIFVGDGNQSIYVKHEDDLSDLTNLLGEHKTYYLKLSIRVSPSLIKLLHPYIRELEEYQEGLRFVNRNGDANTLRDSKPLWFREIPLTDFLNYFVDNLALDYIRSGKNLAVVCNHNDDVDMVYDRIIADHSEELAIRVSTGRHQEVDFSQNKIFVLTMHSSKGLEFDNLLYMHINSGPRDGQTRLFNNLAYTVYTRPKEDLIIYSPDRTIPLKDKMNLDHITILDTIDTAEEDDDMEEIDIF